MMTPQEAIKRIKDFGLYHATGDYPHSLRTVEAFRMAVEALETRILKKVSLENGFVKCNACGKYIHLPIADKYSYCPECGQAIDWSEWDDTTGSN